MIRFTALESAGRKQAKLCKVFSKTGGKKSYPRQTLFSHFEVQCADFNDLAEKLEIISQEPYACVIAGKPVDGADNLVRRLLNDTDDDKATFEDAPTQVVHLDIDDMEKPDWLTWDEPELIAQWVIERLAEKHPFVADASWWWQASNSAGTQGKEHIAKFHLWTVGDVALDAQERRTLYRMIGGDPMVGGAVHISYTAPPVFIGLDDPIGVRSGVIEGVDDQLAVSTIYDDIKEAAEQKKAGTISFSQDHVGENTDAWVRACVENRRKTLMTWFYDNCTPGNRNNAVYATARGLGEIIHHGVVDVASSIREIEAFTGGAHTASIKSGFDTGHRSIWPIPEPTKKESERDKVRRRIAEMRNKKRGMIQEKNNV